MSATVSCTGDTPASVTHVAGHLCYLCPRLLKRGDRLRAVELRETEDIVPQHLVRLERNDHYGVGVRLV